jgi:hypothetical protein
MSEGEENYDENGLYANKEFIPIEDHVKKWADVEPVEQYEKHNDPAICKIDYTPVFENTMKYFRAILKSKEISRRALELTQSVIIVSNG